MSAPVAIPRITLRVPSEAATALGVSDEFFDEHVRPSLRLIRKGRYTFVSVAELSRWAETNSARALRSERV
jgi:hypothetical protein